MAIGDVFEVRWLHELNGAAQRHRARWRVIANSTGSVDDDSSLFARDFQNVLFSTLWESNLTNESRVRDVCSRGVFPSSIPRRWACFAEGSHPVRNALPPTAVLPIVWYANPVDGRRTSVLRLLGVRRTHIAGEFLRDSPLIAWGEFAFRFGVQPLVHTESGLTVSMVIVPAQAGPILDVEAAFVHGRIRPRLQRRGKAV